MIENARASQPPDTRTMTKSQQISGNLLADGFFSRRSDERIFFDRLGVETKGQTQLFTRRLADCHLEFGCRWLWSFHSCVNELAAHQQFLSKSLSSEQVLRLHSNQFDNFAFTMRCGWFHRFIRIPIRLNSIAPFRNYRIDFILSIIMTNVIFVASLMHN